MLHPQRILPHQVHDAKWHRSFASPFLDERPLDYRCLLYHTCARIHDSNDTQSTTILTRFGNYAVISDVSSTDKHLIILCGNFPFGFGEPFLEVEFTYLKKYFRKITICTTSLRDGHTEAHFEIPEDVQLINLNPEISLTGKVLAMFRLFTDEEIRDEMNVIRNSYHSHVNWGIGLPIAQSIQIL